MNTPASFIPTAPAHFIGPARRYAAMLTTKASRPGPHKLVLIGPPGTGKTSLANYFAACLTSHTTQIEAVNGRNLSVERVRHWEESAAYRPMAGSYSVKVINEAQSIQPAAADALRTYLDDLPPHIAVILTANGTLSTMPEPLQSRLQHFPLAAPSPSEVSALLHSFGLNGQGDKIAETCGGNVRAALLDAQSVIDLQSVV